MIHLEISLDGLDYDALLDLLAPLLGAASPDAPAAKLLGGMTRGLIRRLPQAKKDAMAAELINQNSPALREALEKLAAENRLQARITRLSARS